MRDGVVVVVVVTGAVVDAEAGFDVEDEVEVDAAAEPETLVVNPLAVPDPLVLDINADPVDELTTPDDLKLVVIVDVRRLVTPSTVGVSPGAMRTGVVEDCCADARVASRFTAIISIVVYEGKMLNMVTLCRAIPCLFQIDP